MRFIDQHAGRRTLDGLRWGVEPICRVLTDQGTPIAPSTYYDARARASRPSRRAARDQELTTQIIALHAANYGVYGARKVWLTLNRQGTPVARCTVERLMGDLGLRGAIRGKVKRTTIGDPTAKRPADLVGLRRVRHRRLRPARPGLVGRHVDEHPTGPERDRTGHLDPRPVRARRPDGAGAPHRPRRPVSPSPRGPGGAPTSIRFGERLTDAGIRPSVGAVGSSYDNALAETINGLYKTELIRPRGPWRTVEQVEVATAEWVDWFNHRRLYEYDGDIPPAELEDAYYAQHRAQPVAEFSNQ